VTPGVTSSMYGPTALSGVVNFVSTPPNSQSEVVVNGSTRKGSDAALFQTFTVDQNLGGTLTAGRLYQNPGDPDKDGWTEVDGYKRIVVRPRVWWTRSETSSWFMTGGWTSENRRSGTFAGARLPDFNRFSDDADTRHADVGTIGRILLDTTMFLTVRASLTREWRTRWYGDTREHDRRNMIFSDVSLTKSIGNNVVVGGVALDRDQFTSPDTRGFSYRYTTPALFAEHTWTPVPKFGITSSARLDLQSEFGDFVSPRVSVVYRPSGEWTTRLSRATGFYAPTPLTDETAAFGLSPLRRSGLDAEHATEWSLDVSRIEGAFELRGSAYRTVIEHPVVVRAVPDEEPQLMNADEASHTQGIDVYARYRPAPMRFTVSYSYLDAMRPQIGEIVGIDFAVDTTLHRALPLNPRHSAAFDASYEADHDRIIGVELRFTGRQALTDTAFTASHPYVTVDAHLEKYFGPVIFFVRGQNLTGVHMSQYQPVLRKSSSLAGQWTNDVWAPLDGVALNAGLRLKY
jgi:outer membrane receptor protein involved in Fe transport